MESPEQIPMDLDAERALLGSILIDSAVIPDVLKIIPTWAGDVGDYFMGGGDFRRVWKTAIGMHDKGKPIDMVTLVDAMERPERDRQKDLDFVVELVTSVPSANNATYYAEIVRDKAVLRLLMAHGQEVAGVARAPDADADEILAQADKSIGEIRERRAAKREQTFGETLADVFGGLRSGSPRSGVKTGIHKLDEMTSGLHPGEMIVIAARPSMGKTAFGEQIAINATFYGGVPTMFFSLEMSQQELVGRMICNLAQVDSQRCRRGMVTQDEFDRAESLREQLDAMPMFIDDSPALSLCEMRARVRYAVRKNGVKLVVIDYLQLMTHQAESRYAEVSKISAGLKAIAKECCVPLVVLAQLNRKSEDRSGNTPRMADLRDSGAIEQDADAVILLHREDYYLGDKCPDARRNVATIIVEKQRNGPTGSFDLHWHRSYMRFDELAVGEQERLDEYVVQERQRQEAEERQRSLYRPGNGTTAFSVPTREAAPF